MFTARTFDKLTGHKQSSGQWPSVQQPAGPLRLGRRRWNGRLCSWKQVERGLAREARRAKRRRWLYGADAPLNDNEWEYT